MQPRLRPYCKTIWPRVEDALDSGAPVLVLRRRQTIQSSFVAGLVPAAHA
jgi:hypothetical protein